METVIGITGNIGSGKSTVAAVIQELGYPVFDSDRVGRELIATDKGVMEGIRVLFGEKVFENGIPNRSKIAEIAFGSDDKIRQLNALIHPLVASKFADWRDHNPSGVVFREAAIMIETGLYRDLNHIILVTCPEEIRVARVMARDRSDRQSVEARMARQMKEEEKRKFADMEIVNDGKHLVVPQVLECFRKLMINP